MEFQRRVRVGGIEEERKKGGASCAGRRMSRIQDEIADSPGKSSMITADKRAPLI